MQKTKKDGAENDREKNKKAEGKKVCASLWKKKVGVRFSARTRQINK